MEVAPIRPPLHVIERLLESGCGEAMEHLLRAVLEGPNDPELWANAAKAFTQQGKADYADEVLHDAVIACPDSLMLAFEYAKSARGFRDKELEAQRWGGVMINFPDQVHGYLSLNAIFKGWGLNSRADETLESGLARMPKDRRLLEAYAMRAHSSRDWSAAVTRWNMLLGYHRLLVGEVNYYAEALTRCGRLFDAEMLLEEGQVNYPDSTEIRRSLAILAGEQGEWALALERWTALLEQSPDNLDFLNQRGAAFWKYQIQVESGEVPASSRKEEAESRAAREPVAIGIVHDESVKDLLNNFESLGQDCEFGLLQRRYGAESLGLLRWTRTPPDVLLAGLRQKFAGLGELDNVELVFAHAEIYIRDKIYGVGFHTFIEQRSDLDFEKLRVTQSKHLSYLRRIFLERASDGEKIYVYKAGQNVKVEMVREIYAELQRFSPVKLLYVQRADATNAAGTLKRLEENFFIGYLDRLGNDSGRWDVSFDVWVTLCRLVYDEPLHIAS